jgi:hypothetical protein
MKRRVLTSKANKRAMRQLQAATGVKAPFRVLVDSSFIRMAIDGRVNESIVTLTKDLFDGGFTEVFFLPETLQAVLSTAGNAGRALLNDLTPIRRTAAAKEEALKNQANTPVVPSSTATGKPGLTEGPGKGGEGATSSKALIRAEVAAIVDWLKKCKELHHGHYAAGSGSASSSPSTAALGGPSSVWFVASMNYDLRNTISPTVPIIRLSLKPTSVWLDVPTELTHEPGATANPRIAATARFSQDGRKERNRNQRGKKLQTMFGISEKAVDNAKRIHPLPAKDQAFLASIGVKLKGRKRPGPKQTPTVESVANQHQTAAPTQQSSVKGAAAPVAKGPQPGVGATKQLKTLAGASVAANPLSCKKKRKRERFVADEDE